MLSYKDSNPDKQFQKLLCYHYTIGQITSVQIYNFFPSSQIIYFILFRALYSRIYIFVEIINCYEKNLFLYTF